MRGFTPLALAAGLASLLSGAALADPPEPGGAAPRGDPHHGSETWLLPSPEVQAAQDPELPPAATGAIFVPALTDGVQEPRWQVRRDGEHVEAARPGRKIFLQPGRYTVRVGSGATDARLEFDASVVEGRTTFVPVEWAGLRVNVVNRRGSPFRGSYELVRLPERRYVGVGLGAEIAEGERLNTWLLRPGKYLILAAGEGYQARKNFVTLRLAPGELVRYTLVLDEDTGDLLGGGEIASIRQHRTDGWTMSLVFGGTFLLNHSDGVIGEQDGLSFGLSGFAESLVGYRDDDHLFYSRFNLEVGGTLRLGVEAANRPFESDVDELDLELLYMYRVAPWFGPYVRLSLDTELLPGHKIFEEDEPPAVRKLDAEEREIAVLEPDRSFKLADPFAPVELGFGAGARTDWQIAGWMNLAVRLGVGGRQVFTNGLFNTVDDRPAYRDTPEFEVQQLPDVTQFGIEGALIGELTLTRWVTLKLDTEILAPFDDMSNPVIDFRGTIAIRLTSFASLNYTLRVKDDPSLSDDLQLDQKVLLRFAYKIL